MAIDTIAQLILTLCQSGRLATNDELQQMVAHVAQAPFSTRLLKVQQTFYQQLAAVGVDIKTPQLPSVEIHLLKRIYLEQQWPVSTTVAQYVDDLHQAVQAPTCQIYTYRRQGEHFAAFLAPSYVRQNVRYPQEFIFVTYSAEYGTIKTGFQASGPSTIFTVNFEQLTRHR